MANQTSGIQGSGVSSEERMTSVCLTDEDRAIFFRNLGETARHAMRTEFRECGCLTADQRVLRRLRRYGRDGSMARMHIVDRATQGMDAGDAEEVYYLRRAEIGS